MKKTKAKTVSERDRDDSRKVLREIRDSRHESAAVRMEAIKLLRDIALVEQTSLDSGGSITIKNYARRS